MNHMQHDKIRGVLYGVAVGDALGAPVEFMSAESIKEQHGRVTEMIGGGWLNVRPGEVTDDTQMTLCVARGICEQPNAPVQSIGENFIKWANGGPKDIGSTCGLSINRAQWLARERGNIILPSQKDWLDGAKEAHINLGGRSAGNGSLMRTAYVPCYYYSEDNIAHWAGTISRMTHYDPEAAEACELYSRIIGRMLNRKVFDSRWDVFQYEIRKTDYRRAMVPGFTPNPTGYVKDSFLAAVWSIRQATRYSTDFRKAVEIAVNLGGDADTIGAITGGLAGALCGFHKIPESWVDALDEGLKAELDDLAYAAELERERAKADEARRKLDKAARR